MNPELVQLVRAHGEAYWQGELKRAQQAVYVYAAVLVVAIMIRLALPDEAIGVMIPWILVGAMSIYAGASQVNLLPFMNAKLGSHWFVVIVFALLGCGGLIWLLIFASYNNKAKRALEIAIVASRLPEGGVSPYPRPPQA